MDKKPIEILIIEDNAQKLQNTIEYIKEASKDLPEYLIDYRVAKSFNSARRLMKETKFDGYVIDMQFPQFDNEMPQMKKGVELIHFLNYSMDLKPRVVNTSSDESIEYLKEANLNNETVIINCVGRNVLVPFYNFLKRVCDATITEKAE